MTITPGVCSVPECGASIPASRLMCRRHWALVPIFHRRRVLGAWRRFQRFDVNLDFLRDVQARATDAVVAAETSTTTPSRTSP